MSGTRNVSFLTNPKTKCINCLISRKYEVTIPQRKSERWLTKLKDLPNRYFTETIDHDRTLELRKNKIPKSSLELSLGRNFGWSGTVMESTFGHSLKENYAILETIVMNVRGSCLVCEPSDVQANSYPQHGTKGGGWMEPLPWVFVQRDKVITLIPDGPEIAVLDDTSFVDCDVIWLAILDPLSRISLLATIFLKNSRNNGT